MRILRQLSLALPLAAAPLAAHAGVVLEMQVHDLSTQETTTARTYVQGQYVKTESRTASAGKYGRPVHQDTDMIYQPPGAPDGERMLIVNNDEKSYQVMDEATMRRLGSMMGGAAGGGNMNAMMADAMKNLSPEDRARAMAAMKQYGGGMPQTAPRQPQRDLHRSGGTDTVNGIPCTLWEETENGATSAELCVAKPGAIKHGDEIMPAFKSMTAFMRKLFDNMPSMQRMADSTMAMYDKIDGVPVRIRNYDNGKLQTETVFSDATTQDLPKKFFGPPDGYARKDMIPSR
ncbi:MAG: DUF4412 domain-containing protein [Alphaproteobacteria bacterium]|nr:DUF4412 domain-containing protein [Alphaproteobacteria bacterium]